MSLNGKVGIFLPWPLKLYWHQCEVGEAGGAEQKGSFSFAVYIIGYDSYCKDRDTEQALALLFLTEQKVLLHLQSSSW